MCGIAGFLISHYCDEELTATARRMGDSLIHRGPDDAGYWTDKESGIALAHRRLSIIDLSPAGHQPMISPSGRFVMVYNGEIYNHLELRKELEDPLENGIHWHGHADTETLLAGFERWGIEATIERSLGMFALAVWDKAERTLTLARDRMGEKPLYYGWSRKVFLFASELKALRCYPGFDADINRNAISLQLRHSYIPAPYSVYSGIFKLWPGTVLALQAGTCRDCPWDINAPPFESFQGNGVRLRPYWSLREVVDRGQHHPFAGTEFDAVSELDLLLSASVRSQLMSDVPIGAFLSGGVDSSAIVALMQKQSSQPVKTFSIGFQEEGYNESEYARAVAKHIGTEHTELYVTSEEAMGVIPSLSSLYDEPFSDSSQIPTFLISQLTRHHVTVSLSGDGGDELFGGYNRHFRGAPFYRAIEQFPAMLRNIAANCLRVLPRSYWNSLYNAFFGLLPSRLQIAQPGEKIYKLAELLKVESVDEIYSSLISHWKNPAGIVIGALEPQTILQATKALPMPLKFEDQMMYLDAISYLPDDILVKVDRAAMGASLETRVPFLDHRIVEFAWTLPTSMKIRDGQGKWVLRQLLYNYVPKELIERPKQGFGIPIDSWLRGPLKDWADDLLNENRLRREGYFSPEPIIQKWHEYLSGHGNWHYYLWDILMFQSWLESQES